jgi:hypothetical protein
MRDRTAAQAGTGTHEAMSLKLWLITAWIMAFDALSYAKASSHAWAIGFNLQIPANAAWFMFAVLAAWPRRMRGTNVVKPQECTLNQQEGLAPSPGEPPSTNAMCAGTSPGADP